MPSAAIADEASRPRRGNRRAAPCSSGCCSTYHITIQALPVSISRTVCEGGPSSSGAPPGVTRSRSARWRSIERGGRTVGQLGQRVEREQRVLARAGGGPGTAAARSSSAKALPSIVQQLTRLGVGNRPSLDSLVRIDIATDTNQRGRPRARVSRPVVQRDQSIAVGPQHPVPAPRARPAAGRAPPRPRPGRRSARGRRRRPPPAPGRCGSTATCTARSRRRALRAADSGAERVGDDLAQDGSPSENGAKARVEPALSRCSTPASSSPSTAAIARPSNRRTKIRRVPRAAAQSTMLE